MSTFTYPAVSLDTTGLATETKQDSQITELQAINTDMDTLVAVDYATETTLSSIDSKDFATQTTLAALLTELQAKADLGETQPVSAASLPLPSGASTSANQTTANASLANVESDINELNAKLAASLVPEAFDYVAVTYVAAGNGVGEIETVTYKTGGSGGTTVATLTLAYDGSDRLSTVTKS